MNFLMRLLAGAGRLPDALRAQVVAEGPLALEEGLTGSVTRRNYRAPGRYAKLEKQGATGAIAVTPTRLVVWAGRMKHIDVPHDHPMRASITVRAEQADRIRFDYDASAAGPKHSGTVEVRLRTPHAVRLAELANNPR